jgi:tRNA-dihydrouridine synthase B
MVAETGCDGVMIGRAALTNPWIFRQACEELAGRPWREPDLADRHALIRDHFHAVAGREDARTALHKLRTFIGWYTHGLPDGRALRKQINDFADVEAALGAVEAYFGQRGTGPDPMAVSA